MNNSQYSILTICSISMFLILILYACNSFRKQDSRASGIDLYKSKVDSFNSILEWKALKEGLYISKNGDIGLKSFEMNDKISITVYISELCCDGKKLKHIIDTTSFKYLGSSFYRDKNNIYTHYNMSDGGNFWIVGADVATFEILGNCYARDKYHIYGERSMVIDSVDYQSFRTSTEVGCFAKDKYGYLFWDERIRPEDILEQSKDSVLLKKLNDL
jgi:hypothetical protein